MKIMYKQQNHGGCLINRTSYWQLRWFYLVTEEGKVINNRVFC